MREGIVTMMILVVLILIAAVCATWMVAMMERVIP